MIPFTLRELAALAPELKIMPGAQGAGSLVQQVLTDSRLDCKGALFIALQGERFDGHTFVEQAAAQGAAQLGVSAAFFKARSEQCKALQGQGISLIVAEDTQRLLGLCALCVRMKSQARVCALSGSCGKTTVKEMTAAILANKGKVLATCGNFNNDVGVPLTLLNLEPDTAFAVIEQGASHRGDLQRTCEFVRAQSALINNVGKAHIEGFGSAEGVYLGKRELIEDVLASGGTGIVPGAGPWSERFLSDFVTEREQGRLLTFGPADAEQARRLHLLDPQDPTVVPARDYAARASTFAVRVNQIESGPQGLSFVLEGREGQRALISLNQLGAHNALNAAAAATLALSAGADFADIAPGLARCRSLQGRLCLQQSGPVTLIDDAYNASFNAVVAGIEVLSGFKDCCRVLVLGDMGELGSESEALHRACGESACGKVDAMLSIGPLCRYADAAFNGFKAHCADHEELCARLLELIELKAAAGQRCCVLVKGSHAMQMGRVSTFLQQHFADARG